MSPPPLEVSRGKAAMSFSASYTSSWTGQSPIADKLFPSEPSTPPSHIYRSTLEYEVAQLWKKRIVRINTLQHLSSAQPSPPPYSSLLLASLRMSANSFASCSLEMCSVSCNFLICVHALFLFPRCQASSTTASNLRNFKASSSTLSAAPCESASKSHLHVVPYVAVTRRSDQAGVSFMHSEKSVAWPSMLRGSSSRVGRTRRAMCLKASKVVGSRV